MTKELKVYMNPYWAGFGLGLVLLSAYLLMGRGLGASGAFASLVADRSHSVGRFDGRFHGHSISNVHSR